MFLGSFEPNLMDNGRIVLPKKIRDELGGKSVVLTIGFEQCIFGFTPSTWEEVTKPELARPLFSDRNARDLRRKMFSEAISIEFDTQGRCIIPEKMASYAGISDALVIIGAGEHFEIWDKNSWERYKKNISER